MSKGMLLYYIYFRYFDWLIAKEIENQFEKRQVHNILPNYYKGRKVEWYCQISYKQQLSLPL